MHPDASIRIFAAVEMSRSLTSQFFLYMLANPEINSVMEREFGGDKRDISTFELPCNCMPGKSINVRLNDLMTNAKMKDEAYNLAFLRRGMASAIVSVHDEIKRRSLTDQEADMEFLRHIRNACSHGNRFTFAKGEPRRVARFHSLEISRALEGMTSVLFDYITIGDVVHLLDSVTRRLEPAQPS